MKNLALFFILLTFNYSYSFNGNKEKENNSCPCEKNNIKTRKIVEIQKGVTHGNETGVYLYFREKSDSKFNVEKDRKFITNENLLKLRIKLQIMANKTK